MFKEGDKLVCIEGPNSDDRILATLLGTSWVPKKDEIYIAAGICDCGCEGLKLKEDPMKLSWNPENFRKVDESFAENLLEEIIEECAEEELVSW